LGSFFALFCRLFFSLLFEWFSGPEICLSDLGGPRVVFIPGDVFGFFGVGGAFAQNIAGGLKRFFLGPRPPGVLFGLFSASVLILDCSFTLGLGGDLGLFKGLGSSPPVFAFRDFLGPVSTFCFWL